LFFQVVLSVFKENLYPVSYIENQNFILPHAQRWNIGFELYFPVNKSQLDEKIKTLQQSIREHLKQLPTKWKFVNNLEVDIQRSETKVTYLASYFISYHAPTHHLDFTPFLFFTQHEIDLVRAYQHPRE